MPTESTTGPARSGISFVPTPVGAAVLLAALGAYYFAETNVVAVGFFFVLLVLAAADAVAGRRELQRRVLTVRPIRTIATSSHPLTLHVTFPLRPGEKRKP